MYLQPITVFKPTPIQSLSLSSSFLPIRLMEMESVAGRRDQNILEVHTNSFSLMSVIVNFFNSDMPASSICTDFTHVNLVKYYDCII